MADGLCGQGQEAVIRPRMRAWMRDISYLSYQGHTPTPGSLHHCRYCLDWVPVGFLLDITEEA
jgi:hypothetical protein